jgi:hypothetical protein
VCPRRGPPPTLGVQPIGGRNDRLADHRSNLGGEPAADDEHAVFILIHGQRSAPLLLLSLSVLGIAIDTPPRPANLLDVGSRAVLGESEQALFRLRRRYAGERPDLGVGNLGARERCGDER